MAPRGHTRGAWRIALSHVAERSAGLHLGRMAPSPTKATSPICGRASRSACVDASHHARQIQRLCSICHAHDYHRGRRQHRSFMMTTTLVRGMRVPEGMHC